jgi:hypothetical protein
VIVPRANIARVQLTDDAWTWLRGVPNPGTNLPVAIGMGTWKSAGGNDFVVIRRRKPSVVLDLDGHDEFERLVLTSQHGVALVRALRLDGADEPEDVADIVTPKPRSGKKPRA